MAGYYRKRGKDSYELTYRGKYKTIKVNSDREAELSLAAFIVEVEKGNFRKPATLTVKQFIQERWMRDYVNVILAPGTANVYKVIQKYHHIISSMFRCAMERQAHASKYS